MQLLTLVSYIKTKGIVRMTEADNDDLQMCTRQAFTPKVGVCALLICRCTFVKKITYLYLELTGHRCGSRICVRGGPSEILPTSHSGVAAAAKIWASKLGGRGGARAPGGPP